MGSVWSQYLLIAQARVDNQCQSGSIDVFLGLVVLLENDTSKCLRAPDTVVVGTVTPVTRRSARPSCVCLFFMCLCLEMCLIGCRLV